MFLRCLQLIANRAVNQENPKCQYITIFKIKCGIRLDFSVHFPEICNGDGGVLFEQKGGQLIVCVCVCEKRSGMQLEGGGREQVVSKARAGFKMTKYRRRFSTVPRNVWMDMCTLHRMPGSRPRKDDETEASAVSSQRVSFGAETFRPRRARRTKRNTRNGRERARPFRRADSIQTRIPPAMKCVFHSRAHNSYTRDPCAHSAQSRAS